MGSTAVQPSTGRVHEAAVDAELVDRIRHGSEAALGQIYDRYAKAVFASAMQTSRDRWIAEEVVQETFLVLWERADRFDAARGALQAWLMAIARHRAIDRLRAAGRHDRAASFTTSRWFGRRRRSDRRVARRLGRAPRDRRGRSSARGRPRGQGDPCGHRCGHRRPRPRRTAGHRARLRRRARRSPRSPTRSAGRSARSRRGRAERCATFENG